MKIPKFEGFIDTLNEEDFNFNTLLDDNCSTFSVSKDEKGNSFVNVTAIASAIAAYDTRLLRLYHEWLSEQLKDL